MSEEFEQISPLLDSRALDNVVLHLMRYKFFGSGTLQSYFAGAVPAVETWAWCLQRKSNPRARRGNGRGRGHFAGLCRGQYGRQPLRRRAGRAGAHPRPADHASAPSHLWPIAGLSRPGAVFARLGGAPPGDRWGRRQAGRTRDLLARHGIACPTVTGAGTGTFEFESARGVHTELQCGSYIFMDADYGRNLDRDGAPTKAFEPSLSCERRR